MTKEYTMQGAFGLLALFLIVIFFGLIQLQFHGAEKRVKESGNRIIKLETDNDTLMDALSEYRIDAASKDHEHIYNVTREDLRFHLDHTHRYYDGKMNGSY